MKRRLALICAIALVAIVAPVATVVLFVDNMVKKRTTEHVFEIDSTPRFLTEEMSLAFARRSLALEGFELSEWELREDGRTSDPDGNKDRYVARAINPNRVQMLFLNKAENQARFVAVELQDGRVSCSVTIPK